jgi:hypothetical protein
MRLQNILGCTSLLLLAACTTMPEGPSVMALPGTGRSFDQFRGDDGVCRQYAYEQIGGATANQAASNSAVRSAAVGTAVGAVAGALIDGHSGAGVGAGTGLIVGSLAGAGAGEASGRGSQRAYDNAYVQCMYAKGHRVPVYGHLTSQGAPGSGYPMPPPPPPPR